jgi:hypothetical protein
MKAVFLAGGLDIRSSRLRGDESCANTFFAFRCAEAHHDQPVSESVRLGGVLQSQSGCEVAYDARSAQRLSAFSSATA